MNSEKSTSFNSTSVNAIVDSSLPLAGYLVVSVEQAVAAPYCSRLLADQGARVIKVERPDGGDFARAYDTRVKGEASHFVWCNRSKESLALDLKNPSRLNNCVNFFSKRMSLFRILPLA